MKVSRRGSDKYKDTVVSPFVLIDHWSVRGGGDPLQVGDAGEKTDVGPLVHKPSVCVSESKSPDRGVEFL